MKKLDTSNIKAKGVLKHIDSLIRIDRSPKNKPKYIFLCSICKGDCQPRKSNLLKYNELKCRKCHNKKRPYERTYNSLCNRSKEKGYTSTMTYEEFYVMALIDSCHYCSIPLNRTQYGLSKNGKTDAILLDRKDNSIGYTLENSVPCCWPCNKDKGKLNYKEYLLVKYIDSKLHKS